MMKAPPFLAACALLLAVSCSADPTPADPATTPTESPSPRPNPTIITATEEPPATPAPTATSTSEPGATAEPTATASPDVTGTATVDPTDVVGFPFETGDVRAALEERGFELQPRDEREPLCAADAETGRAYAATSSEGGDTGPQFVLWIYADPDALKGDWNAEPGMAPEPRFDCELPTGFVYWNENAVLALVGWLTASVEGPITEPRPSEHPAIAGFLSMSR